MTKTELLNYLKAACEVENAIHTCEEAIRALEQRKGAEQLRRISAPFPPSEPHLSEVNRYISDSELDRLYPDNINNWKLSEAQTTWGIICLAITGFLWACSPDDLLALIIFGLILYGIGYWLCDRITYHSYRKNEISRKRELWRQACIRDQKENEQKKAEYQAAKEKHQAAMRVYQQELTLRDRTIQTFDAEISRLRGRIRTLDQLRSQIYAKRILQPNFCNIVAVNQLYDYLNMGFSDHLEGPDGLYFHYMNDVRTARICDSLTDLKRALESGLASIASAMYSLSNSVRQTSSVISSMNNSLTTNLNSMQRSITDAHNASAARMQSYMSQASSQLSRINTTLATASYNQYVTARETSARDYLRRVP